MKNFVLDTNLFFNMEPGLGLGEKSQDVIVAVTKHMKEKKSKEKYDFLMPPRVIEEFLSFFEDKTQPFLTEFLQVITTKAPAISESQFSATVFYQLVQDIRERSYRGLIVATEELEKGARLMMGSDNLAKKDYEIKIGSVIKSLRERYRQATRTGFIDSLADLDLIVLAREQDAYLVSSDEGVVKWARTFGVREMLPPVFGQWLAQDNLS